MKHFRTRNVWSIETTDDAQTALTFFRNGRPMQRDDVIKALALLVLEMKEQG